MLTELKEIAALLRRMARDPSLLLASLLCPCHLVLVWVVIAGLLPQFGLSRYRIPVLAAGSVLFVVLALWPVWRSQRARQIPSRPENHEESACVSDAYRPCSRIRGT